MFALLEGSSGFLELGSLYFSWAFALVALLLCVLGARSHGKLRTGFFIAAVLVVAPSVAAFVKASIDSGIMAYQDRNLAPVASILPQSRTYLGLAFPAGTKVFLIEPEQTFDSAELQGTASPIGGVPLKGELHPVSMLKPTRDEDTTWEGTLAERHAFSDHWVCAPGKVSLSSRGNLKLCTLAAPHNIGPYQLPAGTEVNVASDAGVAAEFRSFSFPLPEIGVVLPPNSRIVLDEDHCLRSADSFGSRIRVQGVTLHAGFTVERAHTAIDGPVRCAPVTKLHGSVAGDVRVNDRWYKDDESIVFDIGPAAANSDPSGSSR